MDCMEIPLPALGTRACTLELWTTISKALADHELGLEGTLVVLSISSCLKCGKLCHQPI